MLGELKGTPRPNPRTRVLFVLLLLAAVMAGGWYVWHVQSDVRKLSRSLMAADKFADRGLYSQAIERYKQCSVDPAATALQRAECLCRMGGHQAHIGDLQAARVSLTSCQSAAVDLEQPHLEGAALCGLGDLEARLERNDLARRHYEDALQVFNHARDDRYSARALLGLGELEYKEGNYDLARQRYNEALDRYRECGCRAGIADALVAFGNLASSGPGDPASARQFYDQALDLYRQLEHQGGEAWVAFGLGNLERLQGNLEPALKHYKTAMGLSQKSGDRCLENQTLLGLGDVERHLKRYEAARQHYDDALVISRQLSDPLSEANVLVQLGHLERRLGEGGDARQHYDKALSLYQKLDQPQGEANALLGLGELERELAHYDSAHLNEHADLARQHYKGARTLYQKKGDARGEANVDFVEAILLMTLGQQAAADKMLSGATATFTRLGMTSWMNRTLENLEADVEEARKRQRKTTSKGGSVHP